MGCNNENLEYNSPRKNDIFDEEMNYNYNIEILKRLTDRKSTSSRINFINQEKEVLNWQIKHQNDLIRRLISKSYRKNNDNIISHDSKNIITDKLNFENKSNLNITSKFECDYNIYNINSNIMKYNNSEKIKDANNDVINNNFIINAKIIDKNNQQFKTNINKGSNQFNKIINENNNESKNKPNIYNLKLNNVNKKNNEIIINNKEENNNKNIKVNNNINYEEIKNRTNKEKEDNKNIENNNKKEETKIKNKENNNKKEVINAKNEENNKKKEEIKFKKEYNNNKNEQNKIKNEDKNNKKEEIKIKKEDNNNKNEQNKIKNEDNNNKKEEIKIKKEDHNNKNEQNNIKKEDNGNKKEEIKIKKEDNNIENEKNKINKEDNNNNKNEDIKIKNENSNNMKNNKKEDDNTKNNNNKNEGNRNIISNTNNMNQQENKIKKNIIKNNENINGIDNIKNNENNPKNNYSKKEENKIKIDSDKKEENINKINNNLNINNNKKEEKNINNENINKKEEKNKKNNYLNNEVRKKNPTIDYKEEEKDIKNNKIKAIGLDIEKNHKEEDNKNNNNTKSLIEERKNCNNPINNKIQNKEQKPKDFVEENNLNNSHKQSNENEKKDEKQISTTKNKDKENNNIKNIPNKSNNYKFKDRIEIKGRNINNKGEKENNIKTSKSTLIDSKSSSINNSNLNQIKNKEIPYTIKTTFINSNKINIININASFFLKEYLIPIWFSKDTFIKFSTNGKWRISENYDYTNSDGMPSPRTLDFNYGALVARIGSGPPFAILPNDFTYVTKSEGPLYLRINLPKNLETKPEGEMEIKIYDGIIMPKNRIYEKIGWKENNLDNMIKNISKLEEDLIITLNNLRLNPFLFYEHNIKNKQNVKWTEEYLKQRYNNKDENINNEDIYNNYIEPFIPNQQCYSLLNMFFNKSHNVKSKIVKNKINLFLEELQQYLCSTIKDNFKCDTIVNCKLTKSNNHIDICIQFLLYQKIRDYIFNNNYNSISVKVIEKYYNESHLIILAILKIK